MEVNGNGVAPIVTPGSEWRRPREQGEIVRLPSGRLVRLRPVDLLTMAMEGDIPDTLTPVVSRMIFGPSTPEEEPSEIERALRLRKEDIPVINLVCRAAFLSPHIVDDPVDEEEIAIEDVELVDRMRVFSMVTQGADALRRFRDEPLSDVAVVSDGSNVEPATEPDAGPRGSMDRAPTR